MEKILYCASSWSHIEHFHMPYIRYLLRRGDEVHIAAGQIPGQFNDCPTHSYPFQKRIVSFLNLKVAIGLSRLLRKEKYDVVFVHTTLAAFLVRIARLLSFQKGAKVVYTCHGYFFDADETGRVRPNIRSLCYLACEKMLYTQTDHLVLMNAVDYQSATCYRLAPEISFSHGMGVDLQRYPPIASHSTSEIRTQCHIDDGAMVFGCVGEFSKRKNQQSIIRAFASLGKAMAGSYLLFAGSGTLLEECKALARQLGIEHRVYFLGYMAPVHLFYEAIDVLVSASCSEGLPFNIMEAMHYKIPIIATRIKGHTDLIQHRTNGLLYEPMDELELADNMRQLATSSDMRDQILPNIYLPEKYTLEHVYEEYISLVCGRSQEEVPVEIT